MNIADLQDKLRRHLDYLAQDSDNWNLLLTISGCYFQLNDLILSQRYLDDAKRSSGKDLWDYQGLLYLKSGQLKLAKSALQAALAEEDTPTNRFQLAWCLYLSEEFDEALTLLNAISPDEITCQSELLRARILHYLHHHEIALALLEQLHAQYPAAAEVSGLLSLLYFDDDQPEQAEKLCKHTLALDETNSEAVLTDLLLRTKQNKATINDIEAQLRVTPEESRLWFALGITHIRMLQITEAEKAFSKAVEIWPDFFDSWTSLGWCYLLQDKLDLAKGSYTRATQIDEEHADGWGGLALVSALQNDMATAREMLNKARLLDENCSLLSITEVIIGNKVSPEHAAQQLNKAFPEIAVEIDRILSESTLLDDLEKTVIH